MDVSSSQSIIIVGGGIVGLACAAVLLGRGHRVVLIRKDAPEDTASDVAAGMVAPALEALTESEPEPAYRRLKAAQAMWLDLQAFWPAELRAALDAAQDVPSLYQGDAEALTRLKATGASVEMAGETGVRIRGDWLLESRATLDALQQHMLALGGELLTGTVGHVWQKGVAMADGTELTADAVIIAAGIGARALASDVPVLACLSPIKGQLLEVADGDGGDPGVLRTASGYWANYPKRTAASAKFGATMEAGRDDLDPDPAMTDDLMRRALVLRPQADMSGARPRVAVRAATPDGWPLIGRDPATGVLVATGMRRNGYVFAPLAAGLMLDLVEGRAVDMTYRPDRFMSSN